MANQLVVCIAREFGSGGREIGSKLAEELNMQFYDKELLKQAANESGILQEAFEKTDEKPVSGFSYMPAEGTGIASPTYKDYVGYLPNDRMQQAVRNVIKKVADTTTAVIIGRCADYILRGRPNTLTVFLHADLEVRINRVRRLHNIDEDTARSLIRKTDRSRANYYNYYTDRDWGRASNYHLSIDTGYFDAEPSVTLIADVCRQLKDR